MRIVVSLVASLILVGCDASRQRAPSEPEFSTTVTVLTGYRFYNWEHGHTLYALGLDAPVCLRGDGLSEVNEMRFSELYGHLSQRGSYGGMTQCAYVFEVTEVIQDRELSQSDQDVLGELFKVVAEAPPGETPGAQYELRREH